MLFQGSDRVRLMPLPEELLFTLDEKVRSDVSHAKQQYLESVSLDRTDTNKVFPYLLMNDYNFCCYRLKTFRLCVTPSQRLEKVLSDTRSCIQTHLFSWRCS